MSSSEITKLAEETILPPDPERIVNGLRDTGYNFNTAVADIVDNSISAEASEVNITVTLSSDCKVRIYIADNGYGMNTEGLLNAMKYGSRERDDKSSLGKFGLGLKTASTAFCRKLIVLSRDKDSTEVRKVQWDLDHIAQTHKWSLQSKPIEDDELEMFEEVAGDGTGTLVIWDKVDRLLRSYTNFKNAQKALDKKLDELKFHLSMVFQRFLDHSDNRASNVSITVNAQKLGAWDPFCRQEAKTMLLQEDNTPVEMPDGSKPSFHVAAYVIPRKDEFSSFDNWKYARANNDYQGFYIYRENRLIHYGDWLGFFAKEPHSSLLRVEFSFNHELDELLNVDIKKSRILLIGELASYLQDFLAAPRREAQKIYRTGETNDVAKKGADAHATSNTNIDEKGKSVEESKITPTGNNTATVVNPNGTFTKTISISSSTTPQQNRVVPVNSIDDGVLWEPALVDGKHAVNINQSHPYYKKIYGPYLAQKVVVEGLDALLWALAEAENSTCNAETIENYQDMRVVVSRILKKLVADLPDPETAEEE